MRSAEALALLDESPERIGELGQEWNHRDTLTPETKLLHNTEIATQPWKTGLPADYHEHAPRRPEPLRRLARLVRRLISPAADLRGDAMVLLEGAW